jgi:NADH dehydrogenase (ubiquinone) 1 beta subcomplex subunit 8
MNPAIQLGRVLNLKPFTTLCARSMGSSPAPWNFMWKPGPYPETPEARAAAAKKYGMLVEDYKPYEDPDMMCGDYPHLPVEAMAERDKFYNWDVPDMRRDYGEPLHAYWDIYHETRFTPNTSWRYTRPMMFTTFCTVFFGLFFIHYLCEGEYGIPKMTHPRMEQQAHLEGPHYTFEPAE